MTGAETKADLHRYLTYAREALLWKRHAGHADIVRELVDGTVGVRDGQPRGLWVSGSFG